jgi:hypothetical protein
MAPFRPIAVFYEHPHWFEPLFAELSRREIPHKRFDASRHGFDPASGEGEFSLVFNRMSPVHVVGFDPTERLVDALVARAGLEESDEPAAAAGGGRP